MFGDYPPGDIVRVRLTVLLLLAAGCGSNDPSNDTPAVGPYRYTADVRVRDELTSSHFEGTLTITFASQDSIAGRWAVEGLNQPGELGGFNLDAYVLDATASNDAALIAHRIGRGGATLPCEVRYVWTDNNVLRSNVGTCTLTKL